MRHRPFTLYALVAAMALVSPSIPAGAQDASPPEEVGEFGEAFVEPGVWYEDEEGDLAFEPTDEECIPDRDGDGRQECKPSAGSMAILAGGDALYFNALEATEDVEFGIAAEYGRTAVEDQSRHLDLDPDDPQGSNWELPTPLRADVDEGNYDSSPLFPAPLNSDPEHTDNDFSLFCTDLVFMADGKLLAVGGTDYYHDPQIPGTPYGVSELEGLRTARFYDPETRKWTSAGEMHHGRWYPSMVTLASGDVLVASGVKKLIKTLYPDDRPQDSGRNVVETETFDPDDETFTDNGPSAERSLPLYPRLHLLPNGDVYYDVGGQVFNPNGYAYDEALWNIAATYDPETKSWTDLGVPGLTTEGKTTHPGFRGSSFSIMLPLRPDAEGDYTTAEFLSAGGVMGTSPGGYVATDQSQINTVTVSGDEEALDSRETGRLNEPRWYGTGVLLPDGSVMAFSGANRDEVVGPGTGFPTPRAERFDPATETWEPMATSDQLRTYHNTAALLPDGRVLVGGHAPISTLYTRNETLPGGFSPNDGRNPNFEIYSPPYVFREDRPTLRTAPEAITTGGEAFAITSPQAEEITSVLLARNTSITHLVDADQRMVELPIVGQQGDSVIVESPPSTAVTPEGPYLLFATTTADDGAVVPSEGAQLTVKAPADD